MPSITVQKRRHLFDSLTVCVTHDVAANLESCTCIGLAELPLDHLWRSSRIEKKRRATFTLHQWQNLQAGLTEMRRATKGPVVVLTCDPDEVESFWLNAYAPEVLATESRRYSPMHAIKQVLAGPVVVTAVSIPFNCKDGFNEVYYGRPERLSEEGERLACSAWSLVDKSITDSYVLDLSRQLRNGSWDSKYGHLRTQSQFEGSLRLIVSEP